MGVMETQTCLLLPPGTMQVLKSTLGESPDELIYQPFFLFFQAPKMADPSEALMYLPVNVDH
jgi:hypothetical protein